MHHITNYTAWPQQQLASRPDAHFEGLDLDDEASSLLCTGSYGQANYVKQSSTSSSLVLPVD